MRRYFAAVRFIIATGCILSATTAPVFAATTPAPKSQTLDQSVQTVAQSYPTQKPLQQGMIVQIDDKNKKAVAPANYKDSKKMFGVTVAATDAPVSLSNDADTQTAYVVTSGRYNVLVSNQNGNIASGDFVSISALSGVGMKADNKQDLVLGRAVNAFDAKSGTLSSTQLKQSDGKQLKVDIGSISVDIAIQQNKARATTLDGVPPAIQSIATALVGKPISAPQLYICAAILLVGLSVVASLLYGGIQTGMTAIGRNPLARKSIMRNLFQVIITGIMIFVGCLIAVYLVLRL